ncbi:MAG TPA: M28 family peptidase [Vicinamibacterales bacterium]|nr:M28 family peptidase [Vicinamibacterales bacterium]
MSLRRGWAAIGILLAAQLVVASGQAASRGGPSSIDVRDLREWLTYIASDELLGRDTFSSGLGLAASYIENHLREWGVKPAGDSGSYLQTVRVVGVKSTSHSTVTVDIGGERRTFTEDAIGFPKNAGANQRLTVNRVEFVGYGLDAPQASHEDYRGHDVRGAAVVWLGSAGPAGIDPSLTRLLFGRSRYATDERFAAAAIGAAQEPRAGRGGRGAGVPTQQAGGGRGAIPVADFTTTERLDHIVPPRLTGSDAFFEFLFSRAPVKYADLKKKADAREPLPSFRLDGVTLTFDVNTGYEVVRTRLTQNVVAIVEGSDPQLKQSYVAFGAHYDHVGYAEGELVSGADGVRRSGAPGFVTPGAENDRIWNGADDDGSGTVTLMALARAYALGPRPKRSMLFVWHTGEERGLWGSRYFVDHPTVDLDHIVAQLNVDMIGRNRDDKTSEANTVYLVGSDRISTELDQIAQAANQSLSRPLHLDYEFNDPFEPEQSYMRSDHYSYASRGIPIIFFHNGQQSDYHANTDEVPKIQFDKMARIAELIYETGVRLGNLDHAPVRDHQGARMGKALAAASR